MDFEVRVPYQLLIAELTRAEKAVWIAVRSFQGNGASCRASRRVIGERAANETGAMNKATVSRCVRSLVAAGWLFEEGRHLVCNVPGNVKNVDLTSTNFMKNDDLTSTNDESELLRTLTSDQQALTSRQRNVDLTSTRTENQKKTKKKTKEREARAQGKSGKPKSTGFEKPTLDLVQTYFGEQDAPADQAARFFDHFEANGWKVGGRSAMKDWQAAARNWIRRIPDFSPSTDYRNGAQRQAGRSASERKNGIRLDEEAARAKRVADRLLGRGSESPDGSDGPARLRLGSGD